MKYLFTFSILLFLSIQINAQCQNQKLTEFKDLVQESELERYQNLDRKFFSGKNEKGIKITIVPSLSSPSSISIHDLNGLKEIEVKILSNRVDSNHDCIDSVLDCNCYNHRMHISDEEYLALLLYFNTHMSESSNKIKKRLYFDGTDILLINSTKKVVLTPLHDDDCLQELRSNIMKLRKLVIKKRKKKLTKFIKMIS